MFTTNVIDSTVPLIALVQQDSIQNKIIDNG